MKTVKTPKGTELPLIGLKGKDYLQVAHRLVWFNETAERFRVETDFLLITDEQTVARAKVTVFNAEGVEVKAATATKRETKKDFPDHTEKAETGAIGRALALMGYGTQFAIADLDEGDRLADSPVVNTKASTPKVEVKPAATFDNKTVVGSDKPGTMPEVSSGPRKLSSFRNAKAKAEPAAAPADNGWGD